MTDTELIIVTIIASFLASSGFWTYLSNRTRQNSENTKLLMGLAGDKISYLGIRYIEAGYISKDDYDDLRHLLYEPYLGLGGNGTAKRIMNEVDKLPFKPRPPLLKKELHE